MTKEELVKYLQSKPIKLCVFSTANLEGKPESAVLGYAVKDDFTVVLSTHSGSRKCKNAEENNKVTLVIGFGFNEPSVQCDGTARVVKEGQEFDDLGQFFFSVNTAAAKFKSPDTVFIEVKPTWVRVTDLTQHPPKTDEFTF